MTRSAGDASAESKYPSIFVNLVDGAWNTWKDICITNTDGIRRGAPASRCGEANMIYFRHSNNMNMALGDGHVETVYFQKIKVKATIDGVNDCVLAHDYYGDPGNTAKAGDEIGR